MATPEIKVCLNGRGLESIEIFADSREARDIALRAILKASEEIESLERVTQGALRIERKLTISEV